MKKKQVYQCTSCTYSTNEHNKKCPLCNNEMMLNNNIEKHLNHNLPETLLHDDGEVKMTYYCYKCHKKTSKRVCINCNTVTYIILEYNEKKAIINKIHRLSDVFNDEEIKYILSKLSEEEKDIIYCNYCDSHEFFNRVDKVKSSLMLLSSIFIYVMFLEITLGFNERDLLFVAYFTNAIGNILLCTLIILSIWYLIDATEVEHKMIPLKTLIIVSIPNIINLVYNIINASNIKTTLISGFITIGISFVVYALIHLIGKNNEK